MVDIFSSGLKQVVKKWIMDNQSYTYMLYISVRFIYFTNRLGAVLVEMSIGKTSENVRFLV
jgi:hypothetical protein